VFCRLPNKGDTVPEAHYFASFSLAAFQATEMALNISESSLKMIVMQKARFAGV
jgi:hypothetical protein